MRVFLHAFEACMSPHRWSRWNGLAIPVIFKCCQGYQLSFTYVLGLTDPGELALSLSLGWTVNMWLFKGLGVVDNLLIIFSWDPFIGWLLLLLDTFLNLDLPPLLFSSWDRLLLNSKILLQWFGIIKILIILYVRSFIFRRRPHIDQPLPCLRCGLEHILLSQWEIENLGRGGTHHDLLLSFCLLVLFNLLSLFVRNNIFVDFTQCLYLATSDSKTQYLRVLHAEFFFGYRHTATFFIVLPDVDCNGTVVDPPLRNLVRGSLNQAVGDSVIFLWWVLSHTH